MKAKTGADAVVQQLVGSGVRQLFTLSGNQIMPIYDAALGAGLPLFHTRHEAAAVHMADAWGRLTGEPGVALVTAGPGHCNALSALYVASMAESPLVLLSGHAPLGRLGTGAFQEMDQVAVAAPLVKAAWLAQDVRSLPGLIEAALAAARSGRPGPVHVSLPADLLEAAWPGSGLPPGPALVDPPPEPEPSRLAEMLDLLAAAARPLILAGPAQSRGAHFQAAAAFSKLVSIPLLPMESPRGVADPWLRSAASCLRRADLVLLLGKKLDFSLAFGRPPAFAQECRFIQIDADKNTRSDAERVLSRLWADPTQALEHLARLAAERHWAHRPWTDEVARLRATIPSEWEVGSTEGRPLHPLVLSRALRSFLEQSAPDAVVVADGGEFGQWVQAVLEPAVRVINGPSGAIGGAVPMGLAAQHCLPDRRVFVLSGDGSFGFHALELDTAVRYRWPVVVLIGNDARWNAEYQIQLRRYGPDRTVACELLPTRYDRLVEALGGYGELVEEAGQLPAALGRALDSGLPACLNISIEGAPAPAFP